MLHSVPYRQLFIVVCTLLLSSASLVQQERAYADEEHFESASGVRLAGRMRRAVSRLARRYHQRTGRALYVTSGTRSAPAQAEAMYDKLRRGQDLTRLYRDTESASQIQNAYRTHRRRGRQACISRMARVIRRQMRAGRYISRHLRASAVDIRSRGMSARQRRIFERSVAEQPELSLLYEGTPPHFHLQLRR